MEESKNTPSTPENQTEAPAQNKAEASSEAPEVTSAEGSAENTVQTQEDQTLSIEQKAIDVLRTVFDPEIPVNVYDLGLIYKIDYDPADKTLHVDMTLTAPGCPAADFILEDVRQKLVAIEEPKAVDLRLVFDPVWCQDMMSEEAKLELGFL